MYTWALTFFNFISKKAYRMVSVSPILKYQYARKVNKEGKEPIIANLNLSSCND